MQKNSKSPYSNTTGGQIFKAHPEKSLRSIIIEMFLCNKMKQSETELLGPISKLFTFCQQKMMRRNYLSIAKFHFKMYEL